MSLSSSLLRLSSISKQASPLATLTTMSTPSRGRPPRKQARRGPRPSSLMDQAELLPQSPDDRSYGTGPIKREGPRQLDGHRAPINRQSTPRSHAPRPQAARPKAPQPKASQATVIPSKQPETVTTTGAPKFSDFKGLSPKLLQAIPYPTCSEVQAATLPAILSGKDVLAQAKTGTGKTMGFLIPAIQQLISSPRQNGISTLIISPTRELAQQIGQEAQMLLKGLIGSSFNVKVAVGGTNVRTDVKAVEERRIDILVATPGRAIDLLNQSTLANKLSQTRMLVLDEADRLLDQGFKKDLTTIIGHVPASRQTLLFSATMPNEVKSIAAAALKPNHENISTVSGDEPGVHEHVKQELVIAQHNESLAATYFAIQREREKNPNAKVIVFLSTARGTQLFYQLFQNLDDSFPSYEIHSRMSQPRRTRMTQDFKDSQRGVLFSSDVAARGIDIKDIAAVIQVGAASSSEQYIHRLGRTARAGAEGHGVLIISDSEKYFLRQKTINELDFHPIPIGPEGEIRPVIERIDRAMDKVDRSLKAQVYSAWLGYYKTSLSAMKMTPADLVKSANDYAREVLRFGPQPPGLLAKTVGKMGLKGVPGLRIVKQLEEE